MKTSDPATKRRPSRASCGEGTAGAAPSSDAAPSEPAAHAKAYPFDQVCALLDLGPRTLQRWEQLRLVESRDGCFDFQDLVSLRTVQDLVAGGVSPAVIARSVRGLRRVMPEVERPLAQLRLVVLENGLHAEAEHALVAPDGQLVMKFIAGRTRAPEPCDSPVATVPDDAIAWTASDWHDLALAFEEEGRWDESIASYRRALAMQAHFPAVHFNLGYLLRAIDRLEAAEAHLQLAVNQDPELHVAWYVLADVQQQLGLDDDALCSLRIALDRCPTYDQARWSAACLRAQS